MTNELKLNRWWIIFILNQALRQKDACLLQEVEIVRCRLEELERNAYRGRVHQKANKGAIHKEVLPPTRNTQTSEKLP